MTTYKKTLVALVTILAIAPQTSKAVDSEGTAIINTLKTAYTNNFMPNKILSNTDLTEWSNIIKGSLSNYVIKNSTVAGIKDNLLVKSLNDLLSINTKMIASITKVRNDIRERNTLKAVTELESDVSILEAIKLSITSIENPLKRESYFIPNKKNSKEVLLFALEFMRGATETAIAQTKRNIPSGY
jgi:hypothetical protein